jgi:hypothetical protein
VGPALPGSVAAQNRGVFGDALRSAAPPNVTDLFELSNESTDRRRIYRIETGQSFLDLCIR